MAISLTADPTLPQGYIKVNGTTAATVTASGITPSWLPKSSAYTAVSGDFILTNTSTGAFTVTLPVSPVTGSQVVIADGASSWASNKLTVARNGSTIEGLAEDLNCDVSNKQLSLYFNSTTWRVIV